MAENNYRVRFKKGDLEIEVESTNEEYVNSKLNELLANAAIKKSAESQKVKSKTSPKERTATSENNSKNESEDNLDITAIVSAINDSNDYNQIEENILKKVGQLQRIIMCLYFAQEELDTPLTTGNIQTITDQLGVKVSNANAATTIKGNLKYFTADSVRKKGAVIKYKLNRKGRDAYEKILAGEKI